MVKYSKETNEIIEKIGEYYEENDNFQFLQEIFHNSLIS
ncbi:hypothetical protein MBFIL_14720 [Methanobrevibacter filiformis]|uniref:Uncharacterized protein n=1 Tax=Methanobrevibacter filiformis TaxID=55758 RepID=A0A165ZZW9_9EURY|nr:hypothetical protein MBFIL_14720 [Methanobrevibacter filiformis]